MVFLLGSGLRALDLQKARLEGLRFRGSGCLGLYGFRAYRVYGD